MVRKTCLVCGSEKVKKIIDLGYHPFADTFVPESKADEADKIYPLVCDLCEDCGHVQTKYETNPLDRYSQIDYSYTSSNSAFARNHWEDYAKEVGEEIKLKPNSLVVEVGSNDGYLSEQFVKTGHRAIGVDPSPYMANLAKQRNVETIVALFGKNASEEIMKKYGKVDLIIANNVFNHADNPLEFVQSVNDILADEGAFVFEQPYWLITLKSGKFDQIYHEHVSYFTVRSASALLAKAGMRIESARVADYHGGSLRIVARKNKIEQQSQAVENMIKEEYDYGTFNLETYKKFMLKMYDERSRFMQRVYKIKENGDHIVAVGAPAKGNTFLNFYKLDNSLIDYVTDSSPHKKGKYTPASRIPIVGDEIFSKYEKVYALVLSWNIASQLKEILYKINPKIEFISPES